MNTYTIFWPNGKTQIVTGIDAATAMMNAGIVIDAIKAMDFYTDGDKSNEFVWDSKSGWKRKKE